MDFETGSREFIDTRLDTWKSIAQYLSRSSRTVQRWHAGYGLPVHHLGGDATSVYAYADELDQWLRRRDGDAKDFHGTNVPARAELVKHRVISPIAGDLDPQTSHEIESRQLVEGAQKLWEYVSASNLSTIARMYRRATDLNSLNSQAYAGLSQTLIAQTVLGNLHPSGAFHAADAALKRALEIDPGLFEALCASAMLKVFLHRDWEGARETLDRAILERPSASQALVGRAFLGIAENELGESCELLGRAAVARPLNTSVAELRCWVEYLSGRFESAIALVLETREAGHSGAILDTVEALCGVHLLGAESQVQRLKAMTEGSPRNYSLLGVLGYTYGKAGQTTAALEILDSLTRIGLTGVYDFAYAIALTYVGIGETREAASRLEQSYAHGSFWSLGFGSDPILAELRQDAGFRAFCGPKNYPVRPLRLDTRIPAGYQPGQVAFSA